jgi:GntR family transcriptional regulator
VVPKALFLCVEELSGKVYAHAIDVWRARVATPSEADLLGLGSAAGVVHLVHVARAADGTVLEVSESVWPADRIEIVDDYEITSEPEFGPSGAGSEI